MRDSNFGKREPSHEGSVVNTDVQHGQPTTYESIGMPATNSDAKHVTASHAVVERARQRHFNAIEGRNDGRPAYKASHATNVYKKSGTQDRAVPHAQGTKQL